MINQARIAIEDIDANFEKLAHDLGNVKRG
jgi:hypothetical protein